MPITEEKYTFLLYVIFAGFKRSPDASLTPLDLRMISISCSVNGSIPTVLPGGPELKPPAGKTNILSVPILVNSAVITFSTPCPKLTSATTAAIPMTIVSHDLSLR